MSLTSLTIVGALVVALIACICDLRTRRIPNTLTFGAALAGMCLHSAVDGAAGFSTAFGGWLTGLALFLPFYLLRGLGAGDVKLLGAVGAWLGPAMAMWTGLWGALAGGVLAVAVALAHGYLRQALTNVRLLLAHWRVAGLKPLPVVSLDNDDRAPRLAYAVPIAVGLGVALWLR
jgi:prepilin peptidase CpaA